MENRIARALNRLGEDADLLFSDEADLLKLLDEYLDGDDPPIINNLYFCKVLVLLLVVVVMYNCFKVGTGWGFTCNNNTLVANG